MLAHFLDAVVEDRPVDPYGATFADGAQAARIAEAVAESARTGTHVRVEPLRALAT
jgi:predicted dehydrogenase